MQASLFIFYFHFYFLISSTLFPKKYQFTRRKKKQTTEILPFSFLWMDTERGSLDRCESVCFSMDGRMKNFQQFRKSTFKPPQIIINYTLSWSFFSSFLPFHTFHNLCNRSNSQFCFIFHWISNFVRILTSLSMS